MIEETTYIERKKSGKEKFDFESLREQGIRMLQDLSGKQWTDYNTHDPGVTILEQLIFALTELVYLSEFDVKDILATKDEGIKYKDLALYEPLEIFPSENVTHKDYCKSICDNIDGIRNVWVLKHDKKDAKGQYKFLVDIEKKYGDKHHEIIDKINEYYNANRNLCENINGVEVLDREPLEICAAIEVESAADADTVLAKILFECFKVLTPRVVFHSFKELADAGMPLDEILSGPLIRGGYIKDEELLPPRQTIYVSELMKVVFRVDGVSSIKDFYIQSGEAKYRTVLKIDDPLKAAYVQLPQDINDLKIRLEVNGRARTIDVEVVLRKFHLLAHKYKSVHNVNTDLEELHSLPKGNYMPIENFYSVQNQFPAVYGINGFGVPASATTEQKAKAKQLKSYLLLFEQLMVNFLSQIKNIPQLFSLNPELKASYYTQAHTNVPNIKGLLSDEWSDKDVHTAELQQLISKYDDFYDRRNRLLDYVLAMYGERYSEKTYEQFKYYYTSEELPQIMYESKVFFLKHLVKINTYRLGSFNYLKPVHATVNIPTITLKIYLLLGLRKFKSVNYSDVFANHNLQLTHERSVLGYSRYMHNRQVWNFELDASYILENFINVPVHLSVEEMDYEEIAEQAKKVDYFIGGNIPDGFLRYGINLKSYKIGKLNRRDDYTVVFKHPKLDDYIYIGDFKKHDDAILAINCLRQFVVKLNQDSEGMHIVEHILLKPGKEQYQCMCHIVNHRDELVFKTAEDYVQIEEETLVVEISEVLSKGDNYAIEEIDDQVFTLSVWKRSTRILIGEEVFSSVEDAEMALEAYSIYYADLLILNEIEKKIKPFNYAKVSDDFFPYRISVVLPAWSARFNNTRFRAYVEECFQTNLPAHICPEFYWLKVDKLKEFERVHAKWLEAMSTKGDTKKSGYAAEIIRFLLENKQNKKSENDW